MATSPPFAGSPPSSSISLPKKRPSLGAPAPSSKRRKPSAAGPSHLRQTSFPPENIPHGSRSPSVDSSVAVGTPSVVSGAGGPRKRKSKGANIDDGSVTGSAIGSGKGRSVNGTATGSAINGAGAEDDAEDDDEFEEQRAMVEGGKMDEAAKKQEREHIQLLTNAFTQEQEDRYTKYRRVKLRKESVRKLTNHTLSQSVAASIVTTISGYSKTFIGEIVERARDVQLEWQASSEKTPSGEAISQDTPLQDRLKEEHRGPLTPDHLREAFRRYTKDREGGSAGFLGLSLNANGRETTAAKMNGRKLFR